MVRSLLLSQDSSLRVTKCSLVIVLKKMLLFRVITRLFPVMASNFASGDGFDVVISDWTVDALPVVVCTLKFLDGCLLLT